MGVRDSNSRNPCKEQRLLWVGRGGGGGSHTGRVRPEGFRYIKEKGYHLKSKKEREICHLGLQKGLRLKSVLNRR